MQPEQRHPLVSSIISIFRKLYPDHWQHRQEHILRNILLALMERSQTHTLLDVHRMLVDWRFRKAIVETVEDPVVKSFRQHEFSRYLYQYKGEALAPLQNKLGAFLTTPLVRNIVGREGSGIDFRQVMDQGKILLVNVSKGRLGEDNASFLGALLVTRLHLAALSRIDIPEGQRRDFYLFVDEFHSFVAAEISVLEQQFRPEFDQRDLTELPKHHLYLKLAIDGKSSRPFSGVSLPPFHRGGFTRHRRLIIEASRRRFATTQVDVPAFGAVGKEKQGKLF